MSGARSGNGVVARDAMSDAVPVPVRALAEGTFDRRPLGDTGLERWGGTITGEEPVTKLTGARFFRVVEEMRRHPMPRAMLAAVDLLMRRAEWRVEPADDGGTEAQAVADAVDGMRRDLRASWEDSLASVFSFIPYGFSIHEVIYKRRVAGASAFDDGVIGWADWSPRAQATLTRWEFDELGYPAAVEQQAPMLPGPVVIPLDRCLHVKTGGYKGSPLGESVLRAAWDPWDKVRKIAWLTVVGVERDLAGYPVIWVPKSILLQLTAEDAAAYTEYKKIANSIRINDQGGLVMPLEYDLETKQPRYKIELLSTGGQRQFDAVRLMQYFGTQIATTMLADFLTVGHEKTGSFALAESKTGLFVLSLQSYLDTVAEAVTSQPIRRVVALNGWDVRLAPTLRATAPENADAKEIAEVFAAMAPIVNKLAPPDLRALADHLWDQFDWPALTKDLANSAPAAVGPAAPISAPAPVDESDERAIEQMEEVA